MIKLKFEGLCPHCQKGIELIRELPAEIISEICTSTQPVKAKGSAVAPKEEKEPASTTDLTTLEFKNPGEFYTACMEHFGLDKTHTLKEVPEFDLSKPAQRKQAWLQIVAAYSKK